MTTDQLSKLEKALADWEEAVSWIEKGWDCEDEYVHDVTARHTVFHLLENSGGNLPASWLARLEAVDTRYRAATVDDWPFAACHDAGGLDRERHWYWFRRPEEVSLRKTWDSNPEFRRFVQSMLPGIGVSKGKRQ